MSCDSGSWADRRPGLGGYVTGMGPTDGATAAGGHGPQGNPVQFPDSHLVAFTTVPRSISNPKAAAATHT